ncbi:MAG: hypothetical protein KME49_04115 [Brasilonema octagenarum HA4186-MV1]|nr:MULTISPECIES: hypothetical protein [Brasilonema]MBW4624703.1 hypothetical protein [Brasilonema octagenarum HA4186-MV1]
MTTIPLPCGLKSTTQLPDIQGRFNAQYVFKTLTSAVAGLETAIRAIP